MLPRLIAALAVLGIAVLLWQHWSEGQHRRQLFECKAYADTRNGAVDLDDCLKERYGWNEAAATDEFIKALDREAAVRKQRREAGY